MKKINLAFLLAVFVSLVFAPLAFAQTDSLTLTLSRDWGYGGFNNDIQGLFSMHAKGPENLVKVEFYIDDTKIGEAATAPFKYQFTTDDYPLGVHTLYAIGTTSDGKQLHSNEFTANFVSASEGNKVAGRIIIPVLALILVAAVLSFLIPMLSGRGKLQELPLGVERKYGVGGGGICPKCHRPFALPLFSPNLGISKLARCPYCGKMSVVRIEKLAKLREAEKTELTWAQAEAPQASEEDKLHKDLDDSKFQGL